MNKMTVGIIGFQGGVTEHLDAFASLNVCAKTIKTCKELEGITHLVIPGGESSVIGRFLQETNLSEFIKKRVNNKNLAIWGTCAGAILLGQSSSQYALELMNIEVDRNAYGTQLQSFSAQIPSDIGNIEAVFIRAPKITNTGADVEILATHKGEPALCRQKNMLVSSFHPELTNDTVVQQYFLQMNI